MNEVLKMIDERASCRSFLEKEIPEDILNQVLDAACSTPSGGNFQAYSIIKVKDKEKKLKLQKYSRDQKFISRAPVNLVFCIDYRRIKRIIEVEPSPFNFTEQFKDLWMTIIDASISAHTACLAAESLSLKSIYIGNILNEAGKISQLLNLPDYVFPVIMVTLGYPKSPIKPPRKYGRNVLVHDEEYKDMDINDLFKEYKKKNSNWKMKATDKFVDRLYKTALEYHGRDYADKCRDYVLEKGAISPYQYWFGCYYLDDGFLDNEAFFEEMRKKLFTWV
ncbi:FMN reductase [NAD(P)H] [Dethiosulfatibacter aminovorans DSM 17477]|uniref:FMN reductase [NAD(P)H] n=1 Tax=Dethiosulfatibacter aminovorans DSM 17477 TaxID=1121476 RepID=A0A1M6HQ80_9FIRM|nr:nitroreductase family protein [Dethiosulfatibacter aminovorans]SHJ24351.1 FMN reductase [NAD(P)H] [Dethiosulfatibacter aminovorans DSM 17477]